MAEWEQKIRELQSANTICNFYCNHSLFKQNQGVNYFRNWSSHSSQQNDDHAKSKFKEAKTRVMLSWPPITPEITRNEFPSCIISRKWTCSIDLQNKSPFWLDGAFNKTILDISLYCWFRKWWDMSSNQWLRI